MKTVFVLLLLLPLAACDAGKVDNQVNITNGQSQGQDQEQTNADIEGETSCKTTCEDSVLSTICNGVITSQQELPSCPEVSPSQDNTLDQPTPKESPGLLG